jgi:hypothetical protein
MKSTELKKLIREEVRNVLKEREVTEAEATDAANSIESMIGAFKDMPGSEADKVEIIKKQIGLGLLNLITKAMSKGKVTDEKRNILRDFAGKLQNANTLNTVKSVLTDFIIYLKDYSAKQSK